jgi:hypothetical protein
VATLVALPVEGEADMPAAATTVAGFPLLDLPKLALDRVVEDLSSASLAMMVCVCTSLRDRCSLSSRY